MICITCFYESQVRRCRPTHIVVFALSRYIPARSADQPASTSFAMQLPPSTGNNYTPSSSVVAIRLNAIKAAHAGANIVKHEMRWRK